MQISPGSFQWEAEPVCVVSNNDLDSVDTLVPSIRLSFRTAFPTDLDIGDNRGTTVVGHISSKISSLSLQRLQDDRLGEGAKVYLCYASGAVVAAPQLMDLVTLHGTDVHFRKFWELEDTPWANGDVRAAFKGTMIEEKTVEADGTFVNIAPFPYPLHYFAIMVVVPSLASWESTSLQIIARLSVFVGPLPYVSFGGAAIAIMSWQCIKVLLKKEKKKVDFIQKKGAKKKTRKERVKEAVAKLLKRIPGGRRLSTALGLPSKPT